MGVWVTDSRKVYNRVDKPYVTPKAASKRIDPELLYLKKRRISPSYTPDGFMLTARQHTYTIRDRQQWRIFHDPGAFSGRKRKAKGMHPLENAGVS